MVVERLVLEGIVPEHAEDSVAQTLVSEAVSLALSEVEHLGKSRNSHSVTTVHIFCEFPVENFRENLFYHRMQSLKHIIYIKYPDLHGGLDIFTYHLDEPQILVELLHRGRGRRHGEKQTDHEWSTTETE